jgi:hypothetical protein
MVLHTFISSGGACRKPHTLSTCGTYNKPRSRPAERFSDEHKR